MNVYSVNDNVFKTKTFRRFEKYVCKLLLRRRQDCIMEEQRLQLVRKPMSSRSMLSSVRSPTSLLSLSVRVMKDNQFVNSRLSSRGRAIGEKGISRSYCYSENNKICAEMKLCKISEKACKSISTR